MASSGWPYGGVGTDVLHRDDRVMPLGPRRLLSRAAIRSRVVRHPAALVLAVAVSVVSGIPAIDPGTSPGRQALETQPSSAEIPNDPPTRTGRTMAITGEVAGARATLGEPYRIQQAPTPVTGATGPAVKRWAGRFNLYKASAFVTQRTFRWCVAASVQMMVNLVRNHTDRTAATQATIIAYAQRWDTGPYGEDGGTDVTGWTAALRHFGAGNYRAVGATTAAKALRVAATAMRQTGRPAGILVMEGRHAWVLHGFESRTDPRLDARAWITAVRVSGPLYPLQRTGGYDPHPNTRLSIGKLARYFQPSIVGALAGRYVVIIPTH